MKKIKQKSRGDWKTNIVAQPRRGDLPTFRYDSKPSVIMSDDVQNESMADRELKNLMRKEVFRSDPGAVKRTNTNNRRYK